MSEVRIHLRAALQILETETLAPEDRQEALTLIRAAWLLLSGEVEVEL